MNLQLPAHVGHISVYLFIRGSNNFSLQLRNTTLKLSLPTLTHSMLAGVLMWGNIIIYKDLGDVISNTITQMDGQYCSLFHLHNSIG